MKILLIEDDEVLCKTIQMSLTKAGYDTEICHTGTDGFLYACSGAYDCLIIDRMLPEMDGLTLLQALRRRKIQTPAIFSTALDGLNDRINGLDAGADDYMVKPVDLDELLLRIGALLRRAKIASSKRLTAGSLLLDADEHTAYLSGAEVPLTVREFDLLYKLLSYPKKTFTRAQLMEEFWEMETSSGPRTVDVYITKLRDKFSACPDFEIVTVHGLGYKAVLK